MPVRVAQSPLVLDLGRASIPATGLIGGKAAGLERLAAASLPCPPAFCVTTAALDLYLEETGLCERLRALLASEPCEKALRELNGLAYAEELPRVLTQSVRDAMARLQVRFPGLELLAVRSSATDEDGVRHSFAGLHCTELGVSVEGVLAALRKCWASLWSEASIVYRSRHGLPLAHASMAVVVQALVPARASAVVFTANPLTGATDELLIHATRGLGVTLVDNEVTPDIAVLQKDTLAVKQLEMGDQHLQVDARPQGGVVRSRGHALIPSLSEDDYRRLGELALEVERRLGVPVDIEAALSDQWYLIQTRPITTLAPPPQLTVSAP